MAYSRTLGQPKRSLALCFVLWKILMLSLAFAAPGIGYDTSTDILFSGSTERAHLVERLVQKLVRWDALYFVKAGERGYAWEQEWAFSWGFSRTIGWLGQTFETSGSNKLSHIALSGIVLAHISHFLSVLVLYALARKVVGRVDSKNIAFIAAALHIISPAGIFLSAPYTEAPFALLNFSGILLYVSALEADPQDDMKSVKTDLFLIGSGVFFGLATVARGNGLLSGILFAHYCLVITMNAVRRGFSLSHIRRGLSTVLAGILTALGLIGPQWLAYKEFCLMHTQPRPWCSSWVPSIYSFVQQHYWNNGFLRYWTLSNVPLFLIAGPMIFILFQADLRPFFKPPATVSTSSNQDGRLLQQFRNKCLTRIAIPQVVLVALALTNFHIQIITRLASGYPLWYLAVAMWLSNPVKQPPVKPEIAVRFMVIYAMVQGSLFASFLPPA